MPVIFQDGLIPKDHSRMSQQEEHLQVKIIQFTQWDSMVQRGVIHPTYMDSIFLSRVKDGLECQVEAQDICKYLIIPGARCHGICQIQVWQE